MNMPMHYDVKGVYSKGKFIDWVFYKPNQYKIFCTGGVKIGGKCEVYHKRSIYADWQISKLDEN